MASCASWIKALGPSGSTAGTPSAGSAAAPGSRAAMREICVRTSSEAQAFPCSPPVEISPSEKQTDKSCVAFRPKQAFSFLAHMTGVQFTQKAVLNERGKELNYVDSSKNPHDHRETFLPLIRLNREINLGVSVGICLPQSQSNCNTKCHA